MPTNTRQKLRLHQQSQLQEILLDHAQDLLASLPVDLSEEVQRCVKTLALRSSHGLRDAPHAMLQQLLAALSPVALHGGEVRVELAGGWLCCGGAQICRHCPTPTHSFP